MIELMNLYEKLSENAVLRPEKIAIEYGDTRITYAQLDEVTNQIANFLYQRVTGKKNIPILMDRCPELIESVYGIMKAGCLFVPLDAYIPENRLKTMIEEVEAEWVITQPVWLGKLNSIAADAGKKLNVLLLGFSEGSIPECDSLSIVVPDYETLPKSRTFVQNPPNKNCYVYFTTGSTGKPKGIVGRHRSLSHFVTWEIKEFKIDESFRVGQLIAPSFGPYKRDIFVPLSAGATICIPESRDILLDAEKLVEWLDQNKIQLIHTVPALFKSMTMGVKDSGCLSSMKYILISGEVLRGNDIRKFVEIFGDRIQIVNLYGQTESTLAKLFYRVKKEDLNRTIIPAGKAIDYSEIMILDSERRRSMVGSIGEIYIRTPFISAGYYNDPELTRKVFVRNPFSDNPQDIVYKTGDLGRVLPDGNIEICGRADHQIKIRGMKVQLKEIENLLLSYEPVKEAIVVDREDKEENKYLCAYIVTERDVTVTQLRAFLSKELPHYMIPSYFVKMDSIPLTNNGKVNRRELPEPSDNICTGVEYVAPEGETEKRLADLWKDILGIEQIGATDNFFDIGGHSLRATTLVARLHKEFSVQIPLKQIFEAPTIRQLAQCIAGAGKSVYTALKPAGERPYYPVSSAQKRMFMISRMDGDSTSYNLPGAMLLTGEPNIVRLENAFKAIIRRHEILRTSFDMVEGEPVQKVHDEVDFKIHCIESTEDGIKDRIDGFIMPFDLSRPPLIRVFLVRISADKHVLFYDLHHIVSDGTSSGILLKEISALYSGQPLPDLKIQYKDYSVYHHDLLESDGLKAQEEYWAGVFAQGIPELNLPSDFERPSIQSFEGDFVEYSISGDTKSKLNDLSRSAGATMFMMLMAAYNVLLHRYSGQNDVVVGTPVAGRPHPDLQELIGMFLNTLPIRSYPDREKTFAEFLQELKVNALAAFENQSYQIEALAEKLHMKRNPARNPIFDTMFIMQNMEIPEVNVDGLTIMPYKFEKRVSKFDITLEAIEAEDQLIFRFEYCTALFSRNTIDRMFCDLRKILETIVQNVDIKLKDIELDSGVMTLEQAAVEAEFDF